MAQKRVRDDLDMDSALKKAKLEPVDGDEGDAVLTAEQYVQKAVGASKTGLTTQQLQRTEKFSNNEIAEAINVLLKSDGVELARKGTQMLIRSVTGKEKAAKQGLNQHERSVYSAIRDAGNKGIWTRDIRYACNLQAPALNKVLKTLETKRLVKSCYSVKQSKKKVYMLFELEPDRSLTGGAWYSEQSFDEELVTLLSQKVFKYATDKAGKALKLYPEDPLKQREHEYVTSEEMHTNVKESKVFLVDFTPNEIDQIMRALELDGKLEAAIAPLSFKVSAHSKSVAASASEGAKLYRARREAGRVPLYQETPRGASPAFPDGMASGRRHMLLMAQALV